MRRFSALIYIPVLAMFFKPSPVHGQYVHLGAGQQVHIGNEVNIPGNLTNAATVTVGNGSLHFSGNEYHNVAGAAYGGSGYIIFHAPASGGQILEGGNISFGKLRINNAGNLLLSGNGDAGVDDTLDLANGRLELGDHNLNLGSAAAVKGYAPARYVVTNGTGHVSYTNVAAGASLFCPLGVSPGTDYTPALVKNGAAAQTIRLRVQRVSGAGAFPDTAQGIRRVWNLWTSGGGALDTLVLYHHDSLAGSQYDPAEATVIRYKGNAWLKPCPFAADVMSAGLRSLAASTPVISGTATYATGDAYYSKGSGMELPAIVPAVSVLSVCAGSGAADLPYSGGAGGGDQYSVTWSPAAAAAGFADVVNSALPADTIRVTVPSGAAPGTYPGTVTVRSSSTTCVSIAYGISVTVHPLPQPVVHWDGTDLVTDSIYAEYQWYRSSQEIQGATGHTYRPLVDGGYAVSVTDSNGCVSMSAFVQADHVGVTDGQIRKDNVRIYPNPATGMIRISAAVAVDIQVRSMEGRVLLEGKQVKQVDVTSLPPGVYLVQVRESGSGVLLKTEQLSKY